MKTKHLFYTMALAGVFAACTNEEFIGDTPQAVADASRPTVANVTLSLGEADTRLSLDENGFSWGTDAEGNPDKIAAMLMDQNNTGVRFGSATMTDPWNELTWLERYHLVDYVHTNYPFTYENGEWKTDANMLEGNYFLVYPYKSFVGQRQAYFDISQQKQIGNTKESRRVAYANNQHFIGYARLDATAGDSKLKAKMVEVLAPVRINLQYSTQIDGEQLEIHKIVLAHPSFYSQYSVDPTTASYGTKNQWNLKSYEGLNEDQNESWVGDLDKTFNYANFLAATGVRPDATEDTYIHEAQGSVDRADYVYNIAENELGNVAHKWSEKPGDNQRSADKYYYDEAIRSVVKPLWKENWSENVTRYVEVYTYADEEGNPMILNAGVAGELGIIAMVPPFNGTEEHLNLYIYTNKGLVGPVDLSYKHDGSGNDVQTSDAILAADPRMGMGTVTVFLDDPDIVRVPDGKMINNTNDLSEYITYLTNNPTNSRIDIQLTNDVTIDDALASRIKTMWSDKGVDNVALYISTSGLASKNANVRIATKTETNILEFLDIADYVLVQIEAGATADLTWKAHNFLSAADRLYASNLNILVDAQGTLNIKDANNSSDGGWSNVSDFDAAHKNVFITNNGAVNVESQVKNNAGIVLTNVNGKFTVKSGATITLADPSRNLLNGTIEVEADARLSGSVNMNIENRGIIENAGELYSVINAIAANKPNQVKPGRIVITNKDAETALTSNWGQVIYKVLPETAIEITNGYKGGMFIYEPVGLTTKVSDLAKHHVTDAVIKGGTLTADVTDSDNLHFLTLENNATVIYGGTNHDIKFADYYASGLTVANAAWNNNYATANLLTTKGTPTINYVSFNLNNASATRDQVIFNAENITLQGVVAFNANATTKADIWLNDVEVTIEKSGTTAGKLTAGKLYAKDNVNSEVVVKVGSTLDATIETERNITLNK